MITRNFKKILYGLFCCLQISQILCEKVLIYIDGIVLDFDAPETTCDISEWTNKLSNACKCCLFKRVPQIGFGPGQKTIEDIVNECISKDYCTQELIDSFLGKRTYFAGRYWKGYTNLDALYQLYNNSVVIKKISKEGVTFDEKGNLTEQGVKTFLEKAYKEKKLPYEDFKSAKCLKVKDIFAEKGASDATQLFLIDSNCSQKSRSYILKEIGGQYRGTKNLAKFLELKQLDNLIWPNHSKDYPSLAIPLAFLQYNNHYLALEHKADGRELREFIVDYFLNPTEKNKQDVGQAYFDVGYATSKFHQRFRINQNDVLGLTAIHGDFNSRNIFYDINTRQVIFIDNEKMPYSFEKPQYPELDINRLLMFLPPQDSKVEANSAFEVAFLPFLSGYVSGYPKKDWPILFDKLAPSDSKNIEKFERMKQYMYQKKN